MRILVISDTHGDTDKAEEAIKSHKEVNMIIHLGDYFRDAQKLSGMFPDIPIEYIYGNSDFMVENVPSEKLLEVCGKRIFITHGHRYSVKWDYGRLYKKAEELKADMILFGHTHVPEIIEKDDFFLLNPGSTSDPRDESDESYAIIDIVNNKLVPKIYYI
ncbi:MAG TPA: metallophosphoesterase [Clostridia bacterium]|nr:metallophosphoesterase [Clostridia bacterium]